MSRIISKPLVVLLIALTCGLAVPFAFAPHGFIFVEVISLATMFTTVKHHSRRFAGVLWFLFGLGMFGYGVWWIQVSVHQFGLPLYSFSVTVTAGLIVIQALHIGLFGWLIHPLLKSNGRIAALIGVPSAWVLVEFFRSWFGSGFPWLLLGYAHSQSPLAGLAPIGGAYLIAYVSVYLAIALVLVAERRDVIVAVSAIIVLCLAHGLRFIDWSSETGNAVKTATLVQGAVPQEIKWHPDVRQPSIDLYRKLTEPHWESDVIVWPETAIPAFPDEVPATIEDLGARASAEQAVLVVGMPMRGTISGEASKTHYFNSLIRISDRSSDIRLDAAEHYYAKRHLVPFGEYMPFDAILRPITDLLNVPMSDFSSGTPDQSSLHAGEIIIGASICYEDAYAELLRDALPAANVLVNISNDAWFGATIAPHQHLQISQMRALELGRYMLRATNTGISAVIDNRGYIVAKSSQFVPQALTAEFELLKGLTPFSRFGTAPIFLWCALSGLSIIFWCRREAGK
ncbi:MAG: apolipoprotein N-acyltransferase [Gammaproteobacteria bacterium]